MFVGFTLIYTNRDAAHRQCLSLYLDRKACEKIGIIRAGSDNECRQPVSGDKSREPATGGSAVGVAQGVAVDVEELLAVGVAAWLAELALDAEVRAVVGY